MLPPGGFLLCPSWTQFSPLIFAVLFICSAEACINSFLDCKCVKFSGVLYLRGVVLRVHGQMIGAWAGPPISAWLFLSVTVHIVNGIDKSAQMFYNNR